MLKMRYFRILKLIRPSSIILGSCIFSLILHGRTLFTSTVTQIKDTGVQTVQYNNNNASNQLIISLISHSFDVKLKYTQFIPTLPIFQNDHDRAQFTSEPINAEYIRGERLEEKYPVGRVRLVYNGTVDGSQECSWQTMHGEFSSIASRSRGARHTSRPIHLTTVLCPLLVPDGHTFQHFMDGVLPKIIQFLLVKRDVTYNNITFVLYRPRDPIIYEILQRLGIADRCMFVKPGDAFKLVSERLVDACVSPTVHPKVLQHTRDMLNVFFTSVDIYDDTSRYRRGYVILLSRRFSRNGRRLLNEQDIAKYLTARFGDRFVLFRGGFNLSSSIALFGRASLIIGVHGGALYNILFAPSNITVIEAMPTNVDRDHVNSQSLHAVMKVKDKREVNVRDRMFNGLAHTIFWRISSALGQCYWRVNLPSATKTANVLFPIARLSSIINNIPDI